MYYTSLNFFYHDVYFVTDVRPKQLNLNKRMNFELSIRFFIMLEKIEKGIFMIFNRKNKVLFENKTKVKFCSIGLFFYFNCFATI